MNFGIFDTTLAFTFFRHVPLSDIASYKQTCKQNNKILSEITKNNFCDLRALFEFGDKYKLPLLREVRPMLEGSLFLENSVFKKFMNFVGSSLACDAISDSTKNVEDGVYKIFKNKNIFDILDKFIFTDHISAIFCNKIYEGINHQNNLSALSELCTFVNQRLDMPHHERAASKMIDEAYTTYINFFSLCNSIRITENPFTTKEILDEIAAVTSDSLIQKQPELEELVNSEAILRVRFPNNSSVPIKERLNQDLPPLINPKDILESAYQSVLPYLNDEMIQNIEKVRNKPLDDFFCDIQVINLLTLETNLQKHIPGHVSLTDRLKKDIQKILTKININN